MDKTGDVILFDNKAKNVGIATAMTRLFNAVSVQENKPEWLSYFVTMPYTFLLLLQSLISNQYRLVNFQCDNVGIKHPSHEVIPLEDYGLRVTVRLSEVPA